MEREHYVCPVCAYPEMEEPDVDEFGCSTFYICPCCGTEFGYTDSTLSHEELRRGWIESGAQWFSKVTLPPANWSATDQLRQGEQVMPERNHEQWKYS